LYPRLSLHSHGARRDRDKARARLDGKNCAPDKSGQAILACHRDSFLARNRDCQSDGCASNVYSRNCRAVISKVPQYFNHDLDIANFIIFMVSQIVTPSDYE